MVPTETDADLAQTLDRVLAAQTDGAWEDAHRLLLRLVREHNQHIEVIFRLAITRKRLGFDVSADALLAQALERGYAISPADLLPVNDQAGLSVWTEPISGLEFRVRQKPRRASLEFAGFVSPAAPAASATPPSATEAPSTTEAAPTPSTPEPLSASSEAALTADKTNSSLTSPSDVG